MKLMIDIPENVVTAIRNGEDYRYDIHTTIAQGIPLASRQETNEKNIKTALGSFAKPESKTVNILADMSKSLAVIADAMTEETDPDADHKNEQMNLIGMVGRLCSIRAQRELITPVEVHYVITGEVEEEAAHE